MKKLLLALTLTFTMSQAFSAAVLLNAASGGQAIQGGGLSTTTTSLIEPVTGLIVFADNGDAVVNLESEEAQEALLVAVDKTVNGEELSATDEAIIEVFANEAGVSVTQMINTVQGDL